MATLGTEESEYDNFGGEYNMIYEPSSSLLYPIMVVQS